MGTQFDKDLDLAQRVCRELANGNNQAILEVYSLYQSLFLGFALRRLYDASQDRANRLLSEFWLELLNGRAICSYAGKASLSTFLLVILNRRIMDHNAKTIKNRGRFVPMPDPDQTPDFQESPEDTLIRRHQKKVLARTLSSLENVSPRDAKLVRMHLEGLSYEQMAGRELGGVSRDALELQKKTNAIKKQFTRPGTGSLAKFKVLLSRAMEKYGLSPSDLLD
ncbi:MAG: sigma-70 family RNA polymerase sigma factor [Desulfatibacillum sp.]|nr:sigma-70 family RNA polymerase sigma factor [Desulfatibacillum sp.]